MAKGLSERDFEESIERWLVEKDHYIRLDAGAYDKELCLIPEQIISFVKATQPKAYSELQKQYGAGTDSSIVRNVARNLEKHKTLHVLREGVKDRGQHLRLCYFRPANQKTPEHEQWYQQNSLGIVRQLYYSQRNRNSIDVALFVNGIPVATAELKNALSGQNHHNAIRQYMKDRDPKGEPLLEFRRCLVHFAVGTEKVFMTTHLKGKGSFFLPFNQGLQNENAEGFATAYLWEDVLRRDSLLDLIQNYISIQKESDLYFNPSSGKLEEKKSTKLLFPRFHQRRAVHRLLAQIRKDGTGANYLIQHSAGSGKSNTITWLAYQLANFFRYDTDERALFDSVIVVTDRRVLNKQLQENIRQLDKTPGVIAYIDEKASSQDLKTAIEARKRIIITTLQKFPIISDSIAKFSDRRYALLIDEAHSSQSGEASRHMRKTLSLQEAAKEEEKEQKETPTAEEIILQEIQRKGQQENISQFAFTATPKPKTIELFGTMVDGEKKAFDSYTMEEAIEEGFILDVLRNYMSFKRYYRLVTKKSVPDKEYDKKKAVRLLGNYVDLQDHAIEKKARIMLEHFMAHTSKEIQGKARAMLVTRSRLHAVRFKLKFDELIKEWGLPYEALVAFSGTVTDPDTGADHTEHSMNALEGKISIPQALKLPENRILIAANKFQTGFDEPMLHTMFVDKKLGGTSTVQTLSRLNRKTKGKDSTMVLDFVNNPEDVQEDFQQFYGSNYIDQGDLTDPNSLYDVLQDVQSADLYHDQEVDAFARVFFTSSEPLKELQPLLNEVSKRFAEREHEEQLAFRSDARTFNRLYRFLSQVISFADVELEKQYVFLSSLLKKLPYVNQPLPTEMLSDVELESYKVQHQFTSQLKLESGDGQGQGLSSGKSGSDEAEMDFLSKIVKTLNDTYGLELDEEDKVDFENMRSSVHTDMDLMSFFNIQNSKGDIQVKFNDAVDKVLLNFINTKLDFYNKMTQERVNKDFKDLWFNELYRKKMGQKGAL